MNNTFLLWGARVIYLLAALTLLFFINTSPYLDNELYLLGGSCFESALAVEGQFELTLRLLLVITSLLIIGVSILLFRVRSWLYLAIGFAITCAFVGINQTWTQKHLFQGYTWSRMTDYYDAAMRKCYIFDGPQYGVLLAICLVCLWGLLILWREKHI
ncbi:hypothetical protein [uncultured Thiothrix sp.]|uniref:hypothetical protein n=1 Tax=uncultured Thiothrix sp. TaxID=223185 RepID=UPI002619BCD3|nr:hypothetical protein [uncultured Thiothrix sp.]HMT91882.1 hypothetical protein [Thiolinea sp.]